MTTPEETPTPRYDKVLGSVPMVFSLCRALERELASAKAECERLKQDLCAVETGIITEFGGSENYKGHDVLSGMEEFIRHHGEVESERNDLRAKLATAERERDEATKRIREFEDECVRAGMCIGKQDNIITELTTSRDTALAQAGEMRTKLRLLVNAAIHEISVWQHANHPHPSNIEMAKGALEQIHEELSRPRERSQMKTWPCEHVKKFNHKMWVLINWFILPRDWNFCPKCKAARPTNKGTKK